MVKVFIIESEVGWGRKIDEVKEFPDQESAEKFCKDYNTKHNPVSNTTPEWYMYAEVENQKQYGMLRW